MKRILVGILLLCLLTALPAGAQAPGKFNYEAQKKFIPAALGKVYLGMSFKSLAAQVNLKNAEADGRFNFLSLTVPFNKGHIKSVSIRIHGLSEEEKEALYVREVRKQKDETGYEYETEWVGIDPSKIAKKGFLYALYINYDDSYDLATFTNKTFGKTTDIHKEGDYHFYDKQWIKKTSDGLVWLIRSFEKDGRQLQLLGRIDGTEWDPAM